MSGQVRRSLALALAGLVAGLGLVLAVFDGSGALRRLTGRTAPEATVAAPPVSAPGTSAPAAPPTPRADARAPAETVKPGIPKDAAAAVGPEVPSFDIVRVEPNGDAVVAGRGSPNTVVEMLVDGRPVAKALADPNGQFAFVPPALPSGSSEIVLRTRDADGREARSKQSVAVAVSPRRDSRPLVALTAPDSPTVVLSQPGASDQRVPGPAAATPPGVPQAARIVSVDAQRGGRLDVTGEAPPGSDLRFYLNDTLIAPANVGADGKVTFTIGRGIKPGRYQVRIDHIDSGTGKVRSRAEVPFAMPETPVAQASPADAPQSETRVEGRGGAGVTPTPGAPVATPGSLAAVQDRPAARRAAPDRGPQGDETVRSETRPTETSRTGSSKSANVEPQAGNPAPGETPATEAPARSGASGASNSDGVGSGRPVAATRPPRTAETTPTGAVDPARPGGVFVPEISTARITRGDNLWEISRRTYGIGHRYTVIYDANQQQIRDPDLIYPGQIFVLPADKRG